MNAYEFDDLLIDYEYIAWKGIKAVAQNFLGENRSKNYTDLIGDILEAFNYIGATMPIEVHFLHRHLDYLCKILASEPDTQAEAFQQLTSIIEVRYSDESLVSLVKEYCWREYKLYSKQ